MGITKQEYSGLISLNLLYIKLALLHPSVVPQIKMLL